MTTPIVNELDDTSKRIIEIIMNNNCITATEISKIVKITRDSVRYHLNKLKELGIIEHKSHVAQNIPIDNIDYMMHISDLQGVGTSKEVSLAEMVALFSAGLKKSLLSLTVVLGTITIAGTLNRINDLADVLQVCLDSGAKKVLLPTASASDLSTVPSELVAKFSLIFYSSPEDAVFKSLGVE